MIRLQLFSSRQFTDSNDPFRASLKWTKLIKNREILGAGAQLMLQTVTNVEF